MNTPYQKRFERGETMNEKKAAYDKKYQKEVMRQFRLSLHPEHDKDIIDYIDSRRGLEISKQRFVKDIIRQDMFFHEKIKKELGIVENDK